MEHLYAAEHHLVEQYLLNELSPELRENFEDHFFGCQECAAELRSTAAFLEAARTELKKPELKNTAPIKQGRLLQFRPAFTVMALAASLLVIIYQNVVVVPGLHTQVAKLETPEILPPISLVSGNSRGGETPVAAVGSAQSVLLQLDIPTKEGFSNYTCLLYSPQHELLWTGQIPAQQAKDLVSIRVPIAKNATGTYSLLVKGNQGAASDTGTDLANYSFTLNAASVGSGQ